MRNFAKIAEGIDVMGLRLALARKPELWGAYGVRHWHKQSVHGAAGLDDIILRYNKFDAVQDDFVEAVCANLDVECYPAWVMLPEAIELIAPLMLRVRGLELGRCMISRLAPGASIPAHSDRIAPAEEAFPYRTPLAIYYDRYHIVVSSASGTLFRTGEETIQMISGECWWFNNQLEHEVVNNSSEDRIHLIMDIHSFQGTYTPPWAKPGDEPATERVA